MQNLNEITSKIKQNASLFFIEKAINSKTGRKIFLNQLNKRKGLTDFQ